MRRNYEELIKESEGELKVLEAKHRNSVVGTRLRLLRLLKTKEASSVEGAAQMIHYSRRHCQRWLGAYYERGITALLASANKPPGAPERMTLKAWDELEQALLRGEIATYAQARKLVAKYGVSYKDDSSVLKLFKRHKIRAKTGRPRHEKADAEVQAEFKKTSPSA